MIYDTFSKRAARAARVGPSDPYIYDSMPHVLRVQIVGTVRDALGIDPRHMSEFRRSTAFEIVERIIAREIGEFTLRQGVRDDDEGAVVRYFLGVTPVERALDVVELLFKVIDSNVRESRDFAHYNAPDLSPDDAIRELNERFDEHQVGYQFTSGEIIRVDSMAMHANVLVPALDFLKGHAFESANTELLSAHEHYRHGRSKECIGSALAAFESTMKIVCERHGWAIAERATARPLIAACLSNGLLPEFMETQLSSVRMTLESGVPTVRNKLGSHGQGTEPGEVPARYARYALNATASAILLIAEASEAL